MTYSNDTSPPLPSSAFSLQHSAFATRLWLAAGGVLLFILTAAAWEGVSRFRNPDPRLSFGYDLLPSYVAGRLVREGRADQLYDTPAFQAAEARVIREADLNADARHAPWLNPPFFAWLFASLSMLPYRAAVWVWLGTNALFLAGSVVLLCRMLPSGRGWRAWGLVPLCLAASVPFWEVIVSLQNTFLSLLLLCATVTFWRGGRALRAGLVAGLLLFKPQLAAVVACVLVLSLGRRAALGLLLTGAALFLVTVRTMPNSFGSFARDLPPIVRHLQNESPYNWGRQVTLQSFWRLALRGHYTGATDAVVKSLWAASAAPVAIALGCAALRGRSRTRRGVPASRAAATCRAPVSPPEARPQDRLIAAAVACMPLLMPYYMEYDLLLLAVPAVLSAADPSRRGGNDSTDKWLARAWVALFLGVAFNPLVAGTTRLNLAVPLLAAVAALSLARCLRRRPAAVTMPAAFPAGACPAGGTNPRAAA